MQNIQTIPSFYQRFLRHKAACCGVVFLAVLVAFCLLLPLFETLFSRHPADVNMGARFLQSSADYWLGTDELGRDLFLRLLQGGQVSLSVGLLATFLAACLGTFIGAVAGYCGGRVDEILMRLTDIIIALPLLPVLIVLSALNIAVPLVPFFRPDVIEIVVIIALFGWPLMARLVRAGTIQARASQYVLAAHAMGAGHGHIIVRHILPNILSPVIVAASLSIGNIILLESALSFLGVGIQPPIASWGNMLTNAQDMIWQAPHLSLYPGALIFATVIAFNFVGDGLQDALNTRHLQKY